MNLSLGLCLFLVGVAVESESKLTCREKSPGQPCHIQDLFVDILAQPQFSLPDARVVYLDNSTTGDFTSNLMAKLHSTTEGLFILDGMVAKVYLKPTLKSLTVLRAHTSKVHIDPVDNRQLTTLDVEGRLTSIPDNVRHLKNLVTLDLCQNKIASWNLDHLKGLERLRKLNLGHNQIGSVTSTGKVNLPALQELFLHGNRITTLDLTHLKADHLERLYLSQNLLVRVEGFPARYGQLRRVDLHGNKWDCEWLRSTLEVLGEAGVETMSYLPTGVCDESGSVKVDLIKCDNGID